MSIAATSTTHRPAQPAAAPTVHHRRARIARLARLFDNSIRVPVIGRRIGIDGVIGLIPGIGDAAGAALSGYLILEAARAGVRKRSLARMVGNAAIDSVVGSIPLVGDLFDFGFKANARNARIALADLDRRDGLTTDKEIRHG